MREIEIRRFDNRRCCWTSLPSVVMWRSSDTLTRPDDLSLTSSVPFCFASVSLLVCPRARIHTHMHPYAHASPSHQNFTHDPARMVWLFGLMLRGIVHCTALPKVFQPPLGWGTGSVLAAKFAHREWIPVIMLGWFGSGPYWTTLFGVTGPPGGPDFDGVPITIKGVRF